MGTSKHTPGPLALLRARTLINIKGAYGEQIAQVPVDREADARLFAAAPYLLAEVKEFRRTVAYYIEVEKNGDDPEGARLKRMKLAMLDDLIAQATGAA